ncbi:MAG: hypothetical protein HYS40_06080 [Gemmatimonadetes bacterium]|nr:hypothetical protein [Gemmatimonadota bacterium]
MRHSPFAPLLLAALATPAPALAQSRSRPTLVLSISAGAITGHSLWRVSRQPYEVRGSAPTFGSTGTYDTLALSRSVASSLTGGMSATLYPSANLGVQLEVSYLGLPLENGCVGVAINAEAEQKNQQICNNVNASQVSASALALHAGVTLRAASRGSFSPYVRAGVGLTSISRSTVAMEGSFVSSGQVYARGIVIDDTPERTSASYVIGLGLTSPLGPGYQFRLEIRDVLASQTRLDGPVNGLGQGPSSSKMYHHIALTMGLDVVLEKKRGRRY